MDILTFDEIVEIAKKHELENLVGYGLPGFANAVIAEALTKLRSAQPVATVMDFRRGNQEPILNWHDSAVIARGAALYTHHAPSEGDRRDAERLDWLETAGPTSLGMVFDGPGDGTFAVCPDDLKHGHGKNIREAIDAAMSKEQGNGNV